jgi:two-component system, cell cycle sensor histidine kinase and response regulator CckA
MKPQDKHVLIVDDDLELALMFQELLEVHGYQASTAANGKEALKLVGNVKMDAILCDLNMPELAGDLFYREVGMAHPELLKRFIFVTGCADDPLYQSFLEKSKAVVLIKPVPTELLVGTLKAVLARCDIFRKCKTPFAPESNCLPEEVLDTEPGWSDCPGLISA